ncbi:MAG: twin-arginine translocase subunit TatC [Gammaproteobacteria bacterium HGW-Gammaproteobacteria-6]|nr:MAG: twin-arginine translocase subunit TatC [Gammaproteobacteria bacterium HGW-Gammaproteobacteria-6]
MNRLSDDGDSLFSHLIELRTRLMRGVLALVGVFAVLVPFANRLYQLLADPLLAKLPAGGQLVAIDVASPFFAPIKLAFFVALIVSMPVLLYQAWAFVAPGLYKHERRLAKPLLVSAVLLFYLGCAFAYFIMLPAVFAFLTATTPSGVAMMTDISRYLDFVLIIFLAAGLSFEMPIAVIVLVALGVVKPAQLRQSRGYVVVGIFIVAAIITPPDALSQLMLGIPMLLLYEVGVIAASIIARRKPASDPAAE